MSGFSITIDLRLTASGRDDPDDVWQKAQETIASVIGEDRLGELLESGKLKQEMIEVRSVHEFDQEKNEQTKDLVGIIDLDWNKSQPLYFALRQEIYNQVQRALNRVVLTRIRADEIIFDPVSQKYLLREEARGFLNGYLRQIGKLASALAGEPVALMELTYFELNRIVVHHIVEPDFPVLGEASESAKRKLRDAREQVAQMRAQSGCNDEPGEQSEQALATAFLERPPVVLPRQTDDRSTDPSSE